MTDDLERLIDLARAIIEMGDSEAASETLTAYVFAVSYLTDVPPRELAERILMNSPPESEWRNRVVPQLVEGVLGDE